MYAWRICAGVNPSVAGSNGGAAAGDADSSTRDSIVSIAALITGTLPLFALRWCLIIVVLLESPRASRPARNEP
jgi:hypothetical protein